MKRILITPEIVDLAKDFAGRLENEKHIQANIVALRDWMRDCKERDYAKYIDKIIDNYYDILIATPNRFGFYDPNKDLNIDLKKKVRPKKGCKSKTEFYKVLAKALGYSWVRNNLYPEYVRKLGIKTCVYCNAQYGVSLKRKNGDYTSSYEIDHYMPQSKYPFLATSFFNLHPSCGHCNTQKNDDDVKFCLYTSDKNKLRPFSFVLSPRSLTSFLLNHDDELLDVRLSSDDDDLRINHEERFHITEKYKNHYDEVGDLIVMSLYYNKSYLNQINKQFGQFLPEFSSRFRDVVLGFPISTNNVHKRPLTLLKQDIAKYLGLL